MQNKLIGLTVTAVISIIMVTSVLVPFLDNATEANKITYTNYGYGAEMASETISYTWTAGTGVVIGDDTITNSAANGPQILVASDSGYAKINFAGTLGAFYGYDGNTIVAGANITECTITVNPTAKTISITDITASSTIDDVTMTYDSWCFIPSVKPTNVMIGPNSNAMNMYSSSDVYAFYRSGVTWAMSFEGDTQSWQYGDKEYTTDFDGESIEGYSGLTKYNILAASGGEYTIAVSDTTTYAEVMVFGFKATGVGIVGNDAIELLQIVPILLTAGILVGIVAVAFNRRD